MRTEMTDQRRRRPRHEVDPDPFEVVPAGSIVVGVDGSEGSVAALVWALDEARRRGADVDAVLTWEDAFNVGAPTPISALAKAQRKRLEARVETVRTKAERQIGAPVPGVGLRTHIFSAAPAVLLASLAGRATMLVVGARGYGGLRGSLLGSVSQRLGRTADGTTVIVRGERPVPRAGGRRRILVGIDGSAVADAALTWAAATASESGDHLEVVHAWGGALSLGMEAPVAEQMSAMDQGLLDEAAARLGPTGLDFATRLEFGPPEAALVQLSSDYDLLVVGSRGRGSLAGLLLGSVSQHCVTRSDCPVAVVRPRR